MFALQRALYGPLRPIEVEHLSEKAWYAVLDTLLAMPSFREDVGGWLLTMFVLLLAGKVWGWIGEGRVDILEQQPPANPRLFHARLATSLAVSVLFNIWMAWYCVDTVLANPRPGMMVIFTFEFTIQIVLSSFTLLRYCLAVAEIQVVKQQTHEAIEARKLEIRAERAEARQNETEDGRPAPASPVDDEPIEVDENEVDIPGWEDKRRWLFGLEVYQIVDLRGLPGRQHHIQRTADAYHARRLFDICIVHKTCVRLLAIPQSYQRHEHALPRCNNGGDPGRCLHHLQREHVCLGAATTQRASSAC